MFLRFQDRETLANRNCFLSSFCSIVKGGLPLGRLGGCSFCSVGNLGLPLERVGGSCLCSVRFGCVGDGSLGSIFNKN